MAIKKTTTAKKAAVKKTKREISKPVIEVTQKELTEKAIAAEIRRLNSIYCDVGKKNKSLIDGLIKRAAYMRVSLEEMEKDIMTNGITEKFTQSPDTPAYERERPVARQYNTMNRNYQTIMKQLAEYIPKDVPVETKDDGFDDFINEK